MKQKNKKVTASEKNKMYGEEEDQFEYNKKPVNWKKVIITLTIIGSVITGLVMIWLYVIKGKDYLEYKDTSKSFYQDMAVMPNKEKVQNYEYVNEELKQAAISATEDIATIYRTTQGFDYTAEGGHVYADYLYKSDRDVQIINVSKTDYVFGFVDKDLGKDIPVAVGTTTHFPKYMTPRITIRIKDGKIAAIGFRYDDEPAHTVDGYRWLHGSVTDGMKGH